MLCQHDMQQPAAGTNESTYIVTRSSLSSSRRGRHAAQLLHLAVLLLSSQAVSQSVGRLSV